MYLIVKDMFRQWSLPNPKRHMLTLKSLISEGLTGWRELRHKYGATVQKDKN